MTLIGVKRREFNMSNVFRKRGFDAHKEEAERRKKEAEARQGKLWRYFLKDGEEDVPLRFLTEEPILFYEHNIKTPDGKYATVTCTGDDCEECEKSKPSYKGAWLVADGREVEVDEKKDGKPTGKKKVLKDQVRLYVRGATDIAKLDRLSRKFGLTSRPWFATKTGSGTSTSYELDRGEPAELTSKQIENLLAKVPEEMKNHYDGTDESLYDIVEFNIFDDVELGESDSKPKSSSKDDEGEDENIDDGVSSVDDGEEAPPKKTTIKKTLGKKNVFKRK
jgi:hypothetical protein